MKKQISPSPVFLLAAIASCLALTPVKAQDLITFRDGNEVQAKVIEVTETEVKYKIFEAQDGPLRVTEKYRIFRIRYQNGTTDLFEQQVPLSVIAATMAPDEAFDEKFSGPRIGFTYISPGTYADWLDSRGKSPLITQFGWQFEKRLFDYRGGSSGMVEFVPMLGGMEQGVLLPSASLMIGFRSDEFHSLEFAAGPNLSLKGLGLVFAVGQNFHYRNVNLPINIAYVPSVTSITHHQDGNGNSYNTMVHTGHRISIVMGFNLRKQR